MSEGKDDCLVLDFAGNTRRLGPINDPVIRKPGQRGDGVAPYKVCVACAAYIHAAAVVCPHCKADQPKGATKLKSSADSIALIQREDDWQDKVEEVPVHSVQYRIHQKPGSKPSLRVCYLSGLNSFVEWVCFEHDGFPKRKAGQWWGVRGEDPIPTTTAEALARVGELLVPHTIRVVVNKKFPDVLPCTREDCRAPGVAPSQPDENDEDVPF